MIEPKGPVRVEVFVEANPTTGTVEIDREKWNSMTAKERSDLLNEAVQQAISDAGGAGYQLLDPEDEADLT